jgi:hypothetical protein
MILFLAQGTTHHYIRNGIFSHCYNDFGCTGTDSIEVLEITSPDISAQQYYAMVKMVSLKYQMPLLYRFSLEHWRDTSSITINAPGTYSVTVTANGGCTGIGSVTVASGTSICNRRNHCPVTSCNPENANLTVTPSALIPFPGQMAIHQKISAI